MMLTLLSGAASDPGHGTKIRRGGKVLYFQLWFQPTCSCHQLFSLVPQDVTAPEIARGVPLPVYINVHVYILTSESILQSSTELAHIVCIYMCIVVLCTSHCVVFYIMYLLSWVRSLGSCF